MADIVFVQCHRLSILSFPAQQSLEGETLGQVSGCKAADLENLTDGSVLAVGSREVEVLLHTRLSALTNLSHYYNN